MPINCLFPKQLEVAYNKIRDKIKPKPISPNLKEFLFGLSLCHELVELF